MMRMVRDYKWLVKMMKMVSCRVFCSIFCMNVIQLRNILCIVVTVFLLNCSQMKKEMMMMTTTTMMIMVTYTSLFVYNFILLSFWLVWRKLLFYILDIGYLIFYVHVDVNHEYLLTDFLYSFRRESYLGKLLASYSLLLLPLSQHNHHCVNVSGSCWQVAALSCIHHSDLF